VPEECLKVSEACLWIRKESPSDRKEPASFTNICSYVIRARAIGGTTGCSDWCDPVTRMAA
jgi:hypothetical protein